MQFERIRTVNVKRSHLHFLFACLFFKPKRKERDRGARKPPF